LSLHQCKISNDMLTAITGNKRHQMEFVSESYGGIKKSKPKKQQKHEGNDCTPKKSSVVKKSETAPDEGEATEIYRFSTDSDDEGLMEVL
jgi:hypothetical protein